MGAYGQFSISKDGWYYIYGYTALGRRIALLLRRNGYRVDGFVDQNARALQNGSKEHILCLEDNKIDTTCIIIISCQSIATQHQVAEYLYGKGYSRLIFMAAGKNFEKKYAEAIRNVWEDLNSGVLPDCKILPTYDKLSPQVSEEFLLRDRGESVVIWIPVELLYTKTAEESVKEFQERGILNELNLNRIEGTNNEPVVCSETLTAFFDFMLCNRGSCMDYIKMYAGFAGRDIKRHIQDRMSVLQVWDDELEQGVGYFIDAAASVKWNPKGYFNMLDGAHRSMYLYYRGYTKIPVAMKREDYEQYLHAEVAKYFTTFSGKFTLPHPLFYQELFSKKERSHLCVALLKYLKRVEWKKDGFLDLEGRDGYLAVSMKHFGVKWVGCLAQDYSIQDMEKGAELVYANNILFFRAEMWENLELWKYSVVYIKDSMDGVFFERLAFKPEIVFYDKIQDKGIYTGEIIYSYFDECGDARDVVAVIGG